MPRPKIARQASRGWYRAAGIARMWDMIGDGSVKIAVGQTYSLPDAAQAHRDQEARATTGSTLLLP